MSTTDLSSFDASPSLVGYLYQVRMALVLLLRKIKIDPGISISIEKFDDIAFHAGANIIEQLQTKHVTHKSVTDSSVDLWKTLRIWATGFRLGSLDPASTNLVLLTTAQAPDGSAAAYLRLEGRNHKRAQEILEGVASTSVSHANEAAYGEFLQLSKAKRSQLLRAVYIHDLFPGMLAVPQLLHQELRIATRAASVSAMARRLEGWWLQICIEHLVGKRSKITASELEAELDDLREQFRLDNLPIDYAAENVPVSENYDERIFVRQLSLIHLRSQRIAKAILDYYRAVKQRGRWIDDHLVNQNELQEYERKLKEEWLEVSESALQGGGSEIAVGLRIYDQIMISTAILLRASCTEPFVMRGSFHILSDQKAVGWHPQFAELLSASGSNEK